MLYLPKTGNLMITIDSCDIIDDSDKTPLERHRIHQETFNVARGSIFDNAITDFYEQTEAIQDEDNFR